MRYYEKNTSSAISKNDPIASGDTVSEAPESIITVDILYADLKRPFLEYEKYLPLLSEERRKKISQLRFDKDKIVSLLTELLAKHRISQDVGIPFSDIKFLYNQYGKPYIDHQDYHFSISHSGNCILFAEGTIPIGIDVQQCSEEPQKSAMHFFTENERQYINDSHDVAHAFYKIWTSKEAYVKMLGLGLSKPFRSFDVSTGIKNTVFITKKLPEHLWTVCCSQSRNTKTRCTTISTDELLKQCIFLD